MWGRSSTRTSLSRPGAALLVAGLGLGLGCGSDAAEQPALVLAAASSLRRAMPELTAAFAERSEGGEIVVTYGGSGSLREQVEAGAPVDAVLLAGARPVDQLVASGHALGATRRVVARNELVLIGPADAPPLSFREIDRLAPGEKLAIGRPDSVPVGGYARSLLRKLGQWEAVQGRLVFAANVAAVLAYVRRGEVGAGIVYRTDLIGIDDVVRLDRARPEWVPEVQVVAAVTLGGESTARARSFLEFLGSERAGEVLRRHGFGLE